MPGPYRISGALFHKDIPNGPAFSGTIEIEGQKYNISCWPKTSKAGNSYLQISEDKRADKPNPHGGGMASKFKRPSPPVAPSKNNDMDDDIPF
jgi:hypothetical protein